FFFQAEDGIRDATVTGVQTCALPIYLSPEDISYSEFAQNSNHFLLRLPRKRHSLEKVPKLRLHVQGKCLVDGGRYDKQSDGSHRSEERRVGKECRCWMKDV